MPDGPPANSIANTGHGHSQPNHTIYASHYSGTVYALQFEPGRSRLYPIQILQSCGDKPSWLTIDRESRTLYCLDDSGELGIGERGHLTEFAINPNGTLVEKAHVETMPGAVHATLYTKNNKKFIAIATRTATVQTFALPLKSSDKPLQSLQLDDPVKSTPYAVYLDPIKESFIFVLDYGTDKIHIFPINDDGHLADSECEVRDIHKEAEAPPHLGIARAVFTWVFGKIQARLFVFSSITSTRVVYDVVYHESDGCPSLRRVRNVEEQDMRPKEAKRAVNRAYNITEAKAVDGQHIYLGLCVNDSHSSIWEYCEASGSVSCGYKDMEKVGTDILFHRKDSPAYGDCPRSFDFSPSGFYMAIGNRVSSTIAIVSRDPESYGALGDRITEHPVGGKGSLEEGTGLSSVVWGLMNG